MAEMNEEHFETIDANKHKAFEERKSNQYNQRTID